MRSIKITALILSTLYAPAGLAKFEAHEWGTFTSLVGSNGITQHGMYHEDEALPEFVHGFGVTQNTPPTPPRPKPCPRKFCFGDEFFANNLITQKMETPVIYFYSDQLRKVSVNVKFPEGVVTDTYPAPVTTYPNIGNIREAAGGDTTFEVEVLKETTGMLPLVDSRNIYGHARNVGSNLVRAGSEQEKFIFYRGIGRFQPRISILSKEGNLSIASPRIGDEPQALFLIHVSESGRNQLLDLGKLETGRAKFISAETIRGLKAGTVGVGSQQRQHIVSGLVRSGLKSDEAVAMLDTWEHGYLGVPGLRLLYILPRKEVDEVLPLTITPMPENLVRSFVGRIEILQDTEEKEILSRIIQEKQSFQPHKLGRFAEPILRRVQEVYREGGGVDPETLNLLQRLIDLTAKE